MWDKDDPTVVHGVLKGGAERRGYDLRPAAAAHDRKHRAVGQVCVGTADAWECGPADQDPALERLHPTVDDKVARELPGLRLVRTPAQHLGLPSSPRPPARHPGVHLALRGGEGVRRRSQIQERPGASDGVQCVGEGNCDRGGSGTGVSADDARAANGEAPAWGGGAGRGACCRRTAATRSETETASVTDALTTRLRELLATEVLLEPTRDRRSRASCVPLPPSASARGVRRAGR